MKLPRILDPRRWFRRDYRDPFQLTSAWRPRPDEPCKIFKEDTAVCDDVGQPKGQCVNCGFNEADHVVMRFIEAPPQTSYRSLMEHMQAQLMANVGIPEKLWERLNTPTRSKTLFKKRETYPHADIQLATTTPSNWDWLFAEAENTKHEIYKWPKGTVSLLELNVLTNIADPHHDFMKQLPLEVQRQLITRARTKGYAAKLWWASSLHLPVGPSMRVLLFTDGWEGVRRGLATVDDSHDPHEQQGVRFYCWEPGQDTNKDKPLELFGSQYPAYWCYDPSIHGLAALPVTSVPLPWYDDDQPRDPALDKEIVVSLPDEGGWKQPQVVPTVNKDFFGFLESLPDTSGDPTTWTPMANAVFNGAALNKCEAPVWEDCPPKTIALSMDGRHTWVKQDDGRWQFDGAQMYCSAPGDLAALVILPELTVEDTVQLLCCVVCGSTDIRQNADLIQDKQTGEWGVYRTFEHFTCKACGDERHVEEKTFTKEGVMVMPRIQGKPGYGDFMGKAYGLPPIEGCLGVKKSWANDFKREYQGTPAWSNDTLQAEGRALRGVKPPAVLLDYPDTQDKSSKVKQALDAKMAEFREVGITDENMQSVCDALGAIMSEMDCKSYGVWREPPFTDKYINVSFSLEGRSYRYVLPLKDEPVTPA